MSLTVIKARFRATRDTAANWTSNDPTLLEAEIGYETDTGKWKWGDGSTAWTSLAYARGFTQAEIEEFARDAVGVALTEGNGITITVDDGADTITIAVDEGDLDYTAIPSLSAAISAAGAAPDWGDIGGTLASQTDLQAALDAKAPLASPALTGNPTAPTQSTGDNSTKIATTAYVNDELDAQNSNVQSWTSTITAQTGTITSTTQTARYMRVGDRVDFTILITITDAGTGAGNLIFTLPTTATYNTAFSGRNNQVVTCFAFCSASSNQVNVRRFDNATTIATGRVVVVSGTYFSA